MKKSELRKIIRESIKELYEQQMRRSTQSYWSAIKCSSNPNTSYTQVGNTTYSSGIPGVALNLTLDGVQPQPGQTFMYNNEMYVVTGPLPQGFPPSTLATLNVVNTQSVPSDCCKIACIAQVDGSSQFPYSMPYVSPWAHSPSQCTGCKPSRLTVKAR